MFNEVPYVLTIGEDEPDDKKRGSDPGCPPNFCEIGGAVHQSGPIFTGENLIHPEERVVYREEGYHKSLAILFLWYLSSKELCCEYRGEKGKEEHEKDQIE